LEESFIGIFRFSLFLTKVSLKKLWGMKMKSVSLLSVFVKLVKDFKLLYAYIEFVYLWAFQKSKIWPWARVLPTDKHADLFTPSIFASWPMKETEGAFLVEYQLYNWKQKDYFLYLHPTDSKHCFLNFSSPILQHPPGTHNYDFNEFYAFRWIDNDEKETMDLQLVKINDLHKAQLVFAANLVSMSLSSLRPFYPDQTFDPLLYMNQESEESCDDFHKKKALQQELKKNQDERKSGFAIFGYSRKMNPVILTE
jgi:hypothetical protein